MVRPVIGIIGNPHLINSEYLVHGAGEMNSRAVREICNALPVIVPPDALLAPIEELMEACDGFVFTGGRPNVHPKEYGENLTEDHGDMDEKRDGGTICVIEDVADLWALERTRSFKGHYHVLGGRLSALDGIGPEDLNIAGLVARAETGDIQEVILAMNLTVDGQTTAHYIGEKLANLSLDITRLAHGMPVGGELDYLDDGTLGQALKARAKLEF